MLYNKYKIFCETDQKFEYVIRAENEAAPTECPVDHHNHTVNLSSVAIEEVIDPNPKTVLVEESPPFAKPSYRTKWDATSEIITAVENETKTVDYIMPEERYCHGGEVVFVGTKMGDWVEAFILDDENDPKIPEPYRATLCEAWPIIATYISRNYLRPGEGSKVLSTYPLNAKVTTGLILRVKLHTSAEEGERKFATNYFLTKKL